MNLFHAFFILSCLLVGPSHSSNAYAYETNNKNCVFKHCSCDQEISSSEVKLDDNSLPGIWSQGYEVICKQDHNDIGKFPERILNKKNPTLILALEVVENEIVTIPDGRFDGLKISNIYITNNAITNLSKGVFTGLKNLEVLDLSNNQLNYIHPEAFSPVKSSLFSLKLHSNKLGNFEPEKLTDALSDLGMLKTLILRDNSFTKVANLEDLTSLEELSLADNQIEHLSQLPLNIFDLDLQNNRIKHLSAQTFSNLKNLKYLNLESNQISHIDEDAFIHLTKIVALNLAKNYIKQVPSRIFFTLANLDRLDLSGQNQMLRDIEDYAFDRASNSKTIRKIDLSKNRIAAISKRAFCSRNPAHPYANIKEIDFANNHVTSINACVMRQLALGFNETSGKPRVTFKQHHLFEKIGPALKCDCEITKSLNYVELEGECQTIGSIMTDIRNYQCSIPQSTQSVEDACQAMSDFACEERKAEPEKPAEETTSTTTTLIMSTSGVQTDEPAKMEEKPTQEKDLNNNNDNINRNDKLNSLATKQPSAVVESTAAKATSRSTLLALVSTLVASFTLLSL